MENFVFTVTSPVNGTSSMAANSALNRAAGIIPANEMITGIELMTYLSVGSSGTTYNTLGTNQLGHIMPWVVAISYVPTGTSVPSLGANPDDSHFLLVQYVHPTKDRQTINQAGSPAYADIFTWELERRRRVQLLSGVGGQLYFHIWNMSVATVFTGWEAIVRGYYADLNLYLMMYKIFEFSKWCSMCRSPNPGIRPTL